MKKFSNFIKNPDLSIMDSDDDGDYKRRDKFRSERRGYDDGGRGGGGGGDPPVRRPPPADWAGRDQRNMAGGGTGSGWGGREQRPQRGYDNGGGGGGYGRRERGYSPQRGRHDMSPPNKRMRGEWYDPKYVCKCIFSFTLYLH